MTAKNFYPRPPRGGRPDELGELITNREISIHALREEGDSQASHCKEAGLYFYPRPPRGGRPKRLKKTDTGEEFLSTPSARRATPCAPGSVHVPVGHFYPRPPRGGRLSSGRACRGSADFYPRPPRGGRPEGIVPLDVGQDISIHALREEGDMIKHRADSIQKLFLSTPSARRATRCR